MSDTVELSEAKQALLQKYMHGKPPQPKAATNTVPRRLQGIAVPLSFGQQQMWLLSQLIPDIPVYNESVTVHMPGTFNVAALEQSFNEILRRHEAWRTSFPIVDGRPIQVINPPPQLTLPAVDLRHLPKA